MNDYLLQPNDKDESMKQILQKGKLYNPFVFNTQK